MHHSSHPTPSDSRPHDASLAHAGRLRRRTSARTEKTHPSPAHVDPPTPKPRPPPHEKVENFRTPNFELVADVLYWMVKRYDPEMVHNITDNIESEDDRVEFLTSISQVSRSKREASQPQQRARTHTHRRAAARNGRVAHRTEGR